MRVRLIGAFAQRCGFTERELELPEGLTAGELLSRLKLRRLRKFVSREGLPVRMAQPLKDGDRIVVAPIFSGG
ncbi:MAG: MoaD/ThiS family protein [Elusimicrobia bacterium]|nr:MoaD/ThiS family protein [Elusimicrobiota bacterium]